MVRQFHGVPILYRNEDEWYELRRGGIGASDVAGILGISPYTSPFGVWVDKLGALDDDANEAMLIGKRFEAPILDEWESRSGLRAILRANLWMHPNYEWARATTDAIAAEHTDPLAVVEAKTDGSWGWDEIPIHYQAQGQWQMLVTGLGVAIFPVLHQGRRLEVYELEADKADQLYLFEKVKSFWFDHVVAEKAPPIDGAANRLLARIWPDHTEVEVEVDGSAVRKLAGVKAEIKRLEGEQEDLEAAIKLQLANAAVGLADGQVVCTWKTQTANRLDIKRLRAEKPDIAREFTSAGTNRVFRLTKGGS